MILFSVPEVAAEGNYVQQQPASIQKQTTTTIKIQPHIWFLFSALIFLMTGQHLLYFDVADLPTGEKNIHLFFQTGIFSHCAKSK